MTDTPDGSTSRLVPEPVVAPVTFIVRLSAVPGGRIGGIVEHPATGRKERFDSVDALVPVIAAMSRTVGGPQITPGDRCGPDPRESPEDESG